MNVSYKRDMTHNYMVPEVEENISEDDYRIHMLMENHIRGLLPCVIRRINCQSRFFYDITSRQSMEHIYGSSRMRAEDIRTFLRGLHRALREVKKYLLDMDRIVLEPQMIYMDIESREPLFCYLPVYQKDIMQSFRELSMYLLERLDDSDRQAVLLGYEIYRKAREENYSLEKILQEAAAPAELREKDGGKAQDGAVLYGYRAGMEAPGPYAGEAPRAGGERGRASAAYGYREKRYNDAKQGLYCDADTLLDAAEQKPEKRKKQKSAPMQREKRQRKTQQKKTPAKTPEEGSALSGRIFLIVCFGVAIVLLAMAAWLWKLTITQIGGIAFLLVGILAYGCSMDGKKKKDGKDAQLDRVMEEFQEESYEEESAMSDRGVYAAPGRRPAPGRSVYKQSAQEQSMYGKTTYGQSAHERFAEQPVYGQPAYERSAGQPVYGQSAHERFAGQPVYGQSVYERPAGQPVCGQSVYERPAGGPAYEQSAYGQTSSRQPAFVAEHTRYGGEPQKKTRLGDTGVLFEDVDCAPHLVLMSTNPRQKESIVLERDSYVIGKLPAQADIVLEHPSVSRVHAKLERLGNDYYLCDLNSTNGTFINGKRLMVNESVKIQPSDEIAFARVGFRVGKY